MTVRIAWKTAQAKESIASIRYRCLYPAMGLEKHGYESIILEDRETIRSFRGLYALVFVKTFSKHDFDLAQSAKAEKIKIFIDLCDNIFIEHYAKSSAYSHFNEMASIAEFIVVPTDELKKTVLRNSPSASVKVIPDQIESKTSQAFIRASLIQKRLHGSIKRPIVQVLWRSLLSKFRHAKRILLYQVKKYTSKDKHLRLSEALRQFGEIQAKQIIWFGNAGGGFSTFGLPSLESIMPALINVNRRQPIKLLVVTNDYEKYCKHIKPYELPTVFKPWHFDDVFDDISQSDICVVPMLKDDFSSTKSPNRSLLALSLGVPVVAADMPSLNLIKDSIIVDDWESGVYEYLTNRERVDRDIDSVRLTICEHFSGEVIAGAWKCILEEDRI